MVIATSNNHGRSLLVGINYFGSENELHGCVADVHRMLDLLNRFWACCASIAARSRLETWK